MYRYFLKYTYQNFLWHTYQTYHDILNDWENNEFSQYHCYQQKYGYCIALHYYMQ